MDGHSDMMPGLAPTALRPLLGLTVLVVEDSRFASEALRLMCLRSGARIRRADSVENARRHLGVYRPSVFIADVGLPDGSGCALIETLHAASPRIDVILGMSGDPDTKADVMAAGADGFVEKPIESLAAFQSAILSHLPRDRQPPAPRDIHDEKISPDLIGYHDDLSYIAQVMQGGSTAGTLDYVTQFLGGVARSAQDYDLDRAVAEVTQLRRAGRNHDAGLATLSRMVQVRIAAGGPL